MDAGAEDLTSIQVKRAVEGSAESLEWVIAHLDPFVRAQLRFRLGSRASNLADLEDLAGEVWLVTLRKIEALKPQGGRYAPALVQFLGTTSTFICNNFLRRALRRGQAGAGRMEKDASETPTSLDQLAAETRGVVTRVHENEVRELIDRALQAMEPEKRDLLVLRLIEQRSTQELGELLEVPANTVAVRYRRALAQLRESLPQEIFAGITSFGMEVEQR